MYNTGGEPSIGAGLFNLNQLQVSETCPATQHPSRDQGIFASSGPRRKILYPALVCHKDKGKPWKTNQGRASKKPPDSSYDLAVAVCATRNREFYQSRPFPFTLHSQTHFNRQNCATKLRAVRPQIENFSTPGFHVISQISHAWGLCATGHFVGIPRLANRSPSLKDASQLVFPKSLKFRHSESEESATCSNPWLSQGAFSQWKWIGRPKTIAVFTSVGGKVVFKGHPKNRLAPAQSTCPQTVRTGSAD